MNCGVRKIVNYFFLACLCVCLAVENDTTTEDPNASGLGKSRKKRRGCKCVQRYMAEVDTLIDLKLKEFKDVYLLPTLNDKKESEAQRMRDALLRLSGDVAETKNALRIMTTNMASMLEDMNSTQKDQAKLSRQLNRITGAVANLTKYVDTMEQRLAKRSIDNSANEITDLETSTQPRPMPRQCQEVFDQGGMRFMGDYYIMIKPAGVSHAFKVLCKMVNNSGWTVIQKRQDGSVDFFRGWEEYRRGFGSLEGEFWLGNDNIHFLTAQ
ncbi:unnamed protein product, partial [Candidula unifasciata]